MLLIKLYFQLLFFYELIFLSLPPLPSGLWAEEYGFVCVVSSDLKQISEAQSSRVTTAICTTQIYPQTGIDLCTIIDAID